MGQCGCGRDILISLLGHVYVSKLSCGESEKKKYIFRFFLIFTLMLRPI